MADLHFELVTPEKLVLSEDVYMVVVPGTEGDFGAMAGVIPPDRRLAQQVMAANTAAQFNTRM